MTDHIFISYSRKDIDYAQKIVDALAENDLGVWVDWNSIPGGEEWEQEIYRGIEEADAFLFLVSPDSVVSEMCKKETDHAVANGKRILPIVIRDSKREIIPADIAKRNWIFCRDNQDNFNESIQNIREVINTNYEWLQGHTRLQLKALEWERRKDKKDTSRLLRGKELQEAEDKLAAVGIQMDPQPTELQRLYLLAGRRNEEHQRRRIITGLGFGLIILAILALFAWGQRNYARASEKIAISEANQKATALVKEEAARATAQAEKERAEQQARISLARQLSVQSQSVSESFPILSLLLAIEAVKATTDFNEPVVPEALQAMLDRLGSVGGTPLPGHKAGITMLAFSPTCGTDPNHCWFVAGNRDGTIRLWDLNFLDQKTNSVVIRAHEEEVTKIDISPDGHWLVTGGLDGVVRLWDLQATNPGAIPIEIENHLDTSVSQVVFTPDGNHLITGDYTALKMWDLKPFVSKEPSILARDSIVSLAFSRDGRWFAAGGIGFTVYLWDLWSEDPASTEQDLWVGENIYALDFSLDGKWLAAGSEDNLARVWDLSNNGSVADPLVLEGHLWPVITVGFTNDIVLLTGDREGNIRVWEPGSGYSSNDPVIRGSPGMSKIKVGPNGVPIAIVRNNTITLWPEIWHSFPQTSSSHDGTVNDLVFSPDSHWLATGGEDGIARLYSINDGLIANPRTLPQNDVLDLSLSTCTKSEWFGGWSYSELQAAYPTLDLKPILGDYDSYNYDLSPSGRWLLICDSGGKCWLWDLQAGNGTAPAKIFNGHANEVASLCFSADEQWLATSGRYDGAIWFWDLNDSDPFDQSIVLSPGQTMLIEYFDPDEGWLVAQELETHELESWVWQLKWENLIVFSCQLVGRNITNAEWNQYFPDEKYRITCPQWPAED